MTTYCPICIIGIEVNNMTNKKNSIVGFGNNTENKLTVQKSRPLFSLWKSDMTLAEFKILDTYLSRIDSHTPDKRTVIFSKGELEQLLGVSKINKAALNKRLNNLGRFVELEKNDHKIHKVALFEEAYGELDENGLWQVKLTCTQAAMKYIFNIDELGYLRYKLRCITSLTSRYTYVLFCYLESNRFKKSWEVNVSDLREILNCQEESYAAFKVFNDRVLKRCQKELLEKTECKYSYEPIKKGRSVVAIKFTIETLPQITFNDLDPDQLTIDQYFEIKELWQEPLLPLNFTQEQLAVIRETLLIVPISKLPDNPDWNDDVEIMRYHYLRIKIADMNNRSVKSKYSYLLAMLKRDAGID